MKKILIILCALFFGYTAVLGTAQASDYYLNEPLFRAIKHQNVPEVKHLLDLGASPNSVEMDYDGGYRTALGECIEVENPELVQILIDAGADVNRSYDVDHSMTPLMQAAAQDDLEIAKTLIQNGAEVNRKSSGCNLVGNTPIFYVISSPMLGLFLENGADVALYSANGGDVLNSLLSSSRNLSRISGVIERLVELGVDINADDGSVGTPLDDLDYYHGTDPLYLGTRLFLMGHGAKCLRYCGQFQG